MLRRTPHELSNGINHSNVQRTFLITPLSVHLSLDSIGVEWRETNFPSNRKTWVNATHPFESVARTALYPNGEMFAQVGDDGPVRRWNLPVDESWPRTPRSLTPSWR